MTEPRISSVGSSVSRLYWDSIRSAGEGSLKDIMGHLDQLARIADMGSPLQAGSALRALDAASGGRTATDTFLAGRDGRISDTRDGARTSGRDGTRPTIGNGPASPALGTITDGKGKTGFPTPPAAPATGDGSGVHGSSQPGIGDHLTEDVFYRVADAADAMGMANAARHMRHYLGNSGSTLQIDPSAMMRDLPAIKARVDASYQSGVVDAAKAKIAAEYNGAPMTFQISTPWKSEYATKGMSQDWFYAVGGFSFNHTATVTVTPGANGKPDVRIEAQLNVFDRYNWDGGKSVTIGPFTVTDEQLGRLHKVGLAQEYEVRGTSNLALQRVALP